MTADAFQETRPPDRSWTEHPLFHGLTPETLMTVAAHVTLRRYRAETAVFRQGDMASHLFLVVSGEVQIRRDLDGQEVVISTLRRGDIFGEMGLLTDYRRTASVVAVTDVEVYALTREGFDVLIGQNFALAHELVQIHNSRSVALERASTSTAVAVTPGTPPETGPLTPPPPNPSIESQVLTVFSPAGGTGKTMLACNLGVLLARRFPGSVVLVDLSVLASQCALLLNVGGKRSVAGYISAGVAADVASFDAATWTSEMLGRHDSGLLVLSMAHTALEAVTLTPDTVQTVLDSVSRAFPIVIVDTTSVYSDVNLTVLARTTRLLLLSNYELTALRGMMECVTALADADNPLEKRSSFILNNTRARPPIRGSEFEARVKLPLTSQLPYGEDLPSLAARNGTALVDMKGQSPLARELGSLAERLIASPARRT